MNKKGFTLVELIAVVVIMAIIALIATPNIISMLDNGKKEDFKNNAEEIISKATYMYKLDKYNDKFVENKTKIYLKDINDIGDIEDPYGGEYDLNNSYVTFTLVTNGITERKASIYIKSCTDKTCYIMGPVEKNSLKTATITETPNN